MNLFSQLPRLALASSLAVFTLHPASAEMRTFTDTQGRKIEAEIVGVSGSKVTLKLANGKTYTIPLTKLSKDDQFFVEVWADVDKKEGGQKTEGAGTVIPDNVNYRFELDVNKERIKKGDKTRVDRGEYKLDEWIFKVELENRSQVDLEGLEMSYRIYVDTKASVKLGSLEEPPKFYGGRVKVDPIDDGDSVLVKTGSAKLMELELDGDFVFNDGSRNKLDDDLEGVWIKVWHGDKKVAEYKTSNSTVKEAKWSDDEPADPNSESEE